MPYPPRPTLAPLAPQAPLPTGPGLPGQPPAAAYLPPDGYDAVEDYDAADAYGPPGGYGPSDGYDDWYAGEDYPDAAEPSGPDPAAGPEPAPARPGEEGGRVATGDGDVAGAGAGGLLPGAGGAARSVTGSPGAGSRGEPSPAPAATAPPPAGLPVAAAPPAAAPLAGPPPAAPPPVPLRPQGGLAGLLRAPAESPVQVPVPPPQVPVPPPPVTQVAETADSLTVDVLLPGRSRLADDSVPVADGWRRMLYRGSAGLIRPPESAAQQQRRALMARARTPVTGGHHRVAVLSLKGGVGKTTTAVGLGSTLASLRGDRVIAVDANPDRGTLSDKLRLETSATVRDLLNERSQIKRYADVRAFTTQAQSRLEVLASDRDPTVSVAFSEEDYADVAAVLEHYYSICITDCGTGLLHSAMAGVLRLADQIVLVSSPSVDGARSASATLDWLAAHDYGTLVERAVVVLSAVHPRGRGSVDLTRLEQHFAARCRAVVRIPYDPHLAEGAEVELGRLSRQTAGAYLALAAEVGDGFAWQRRPAP